MLTILEFLDVFTNASSSNTGVALNVHVVPQSQNNILDLDSQFSGGRENESLSLPDGGIDGLQNRDTKGGGFTGTGLSLSDDVSTRDDGLDGTLLDSGGLFEVWNASARHFL